VTIENSAQEKKQITLNKNNFDGMTICEATLPSETKKVRFQSNQIDIPSVLEKVVVLGDTGCRLSYKNGKGTLQNCNDEKEWPFQQIMNSIEKEKADLVVHLGDYHYREVCQGDEKCQSFQDTLGYGYKAWAADFLNPSSAVLGKTPYVFLRGNHEDCNRAHEGYFKMLSPEGEDKCVEAQPTRYTNFGNLLVVNYDNSALENGPADEKSAGYILMKNNYKKLIEELNSRPEQDVWLFVHKPFWGLSPRMANMAGKSEAVDKKPEISNPNMQKFFAELPLPKKVKMIFSGHIHAVQLATGLHPTQMIIGESGTSLDYFDNETRKFIPEGYRVFPSDYGYVLMSKDANGKWTASIKSTQGETDFICQLNEPGVPCLAFK
jgi:hypothetical protein